MDAGDATLEVPQEVLDYLHRQNRLTLATATPNGIPHAASYVYVNDGLALYICTQPDTVTTRQLDQNPTVAFTIDEYIADWSKTQGIQGSGECQVLLQPDEIKRVVARFQAKFPFLTDSRTANLSFFRITPTAIQFINNADRHGEQAGQALGVDYRRSMVYNVFSSLPPREVAALETHLETVQIAAGQTIVRQGAPADKFFIIVAGEVEVLHEDGDRQRTLATLGPGQFFGEMAIMRDTPRTATVRATKPTTLLTMDRDSFRTLVAQSLGTTQNFDRVVQQRLAGLHASETA